MDATSLIDTILDRSVVLGYGNTGFEARRLIRSYAGTAAQALDVRPVGCDLSSLAALHAFTGWFGRQEQRLDVLVNNAGVMPGQRTRTVDGVELTFATHVLAPWILIDELTPLLRNAAPSRVINVTSGGQYDQKIPGGDVESDRAKYGPKRIYARTKREELVLTEQWAQRLAGTGVHVHAMHPGWADTAGVRNWMPLFRWPGGRRPGPRDIFRRSRRRTAGEPAVRAPVSAAEPGRSLSWRDRAPGPLPPAA